MRTISIAVHDQMLAAALAVPRVTQPLSPQETLRARSARYQAGNTPYPAWYFFGCRHKGVEGLVSRYSRDNYHVSLIPAGLLTPNLKTELLDVQFCALSDRLYAQLKQKGIQIRGYLPEDLASKATQAAYVGQHGGHDFLPPQAVFSRDTPPTLPENHSGLWILKSFHGSAGRNHSGNHYTVWTDSRLRQNLSQVISALQPQEKVICSAFVITEDPYADGADHVVHKMHITLSNGTARPYGRICQRFIHRLNHKHLTQAGVLALPDVIGIPEITTGSIGHLPQITELASTFCFTDNPLIFSADFMLPADGIPRFLECNKLAATFAEKFDPELPPIIDFYPSLH